jgi:hypothetical protein
MIITEEKIKKLTELWFVYGNHGKLKTMGNHRFIQDLLSLRVGDDATQQFKKDSKIFKKSQIKGWELTNECIEKVKEILT